MGLLELFKQRNAYACFLLFVTLTTQGPTQGLYGISMCAEPAGSCVQENARPQDLEGDCGTYLLKPHTFNHTWEMRPPDQHILQNADLLRNSLNTTS